jgi:hypothetical protein
MCPIRILKTAALLALVAGTHAVHAGDARADAASAPQHPATLATRADSQLRQADVPSVKTDPGSSLAARADADLASRAADDQRPRLHVERQNLKGRAAAKAIAQQTTPNTIEHDTAYGDKDHTQQVTNLKVTLKKRGDTGH